MVMGDDTCDESIDDLEGIDRDVWIDEKIERLRNDFFAAIAAGDEVQARQFVARFEASLAHLPTSVRDEVISDTTVMLGDELKARRELGRDGD